MNGGNKPSTRCQYEGCDGHPVDGLHCLEHLDTLAIADMANAVRDGELLDVRNTRIEADRLQALLHAIEDEDGVPQLSGCDFRGATFAGLANFRGATFKGDAKFLGAKFEGLAIFGGVRFQRRADFQWATFDHVASFTNACFGGVAGFGKTTFNDEAGFGLAHFERDAHFAEADFCADVIYAEARFDAGANFHQATFAEGVQLRDARFLGHADFLSATFRRARRFGPLKVSKRLVLDECLFVERVSVEIRAGEVSGRATTFAAGAHLRICRADIALDHADFARASTLSGATTMPESDRRDAQGLDGDGAELTPPRLITLRGAHVAALSLSDIELHACRFFGAYGLESLSIGANCGWARSPQRYGARELLAEEYHWRANNGRVRTQRRWQKSDWHSRTGAPGWLAGRDLSRPLADGETGDLRPRQIAALYRALRKAREDGKDEAGASDLYFGEMEMRRHGAASTASLSDRFVLGLYGLSSGYGLRASRALGWLLLVVFAASLGLWAWGFDHDQSYSRALLVGFESTSSLLRAPDARKFEPTGAGEVIQIVLRLLGPLLLGLALLAVRARVKR
jgi:uncharacterized protein YjbI with pentapeptide repeats